MNRYSVGQQIKLSVAFTDPTQTPPAAVDPGAVTCRVLDPQGQTTTPAVTKDATGSYHAMFTPTAEGIHFYRFEGTAPWQAASPDQQFEATSTVFTPGGAASRAPS